MAGSARRQQPFAEPTAAIRRVFAQLPPLVDHALWCVFTGVGGHWALLGDGAGFRIRLLCPGRGLARGRTDGDGDSRCTRGWRGDLEGDAGRSRDYDAAGEAGEARPAHGQPYLAPRSREEVLA